MERSLTTTLSASLPPSQITRVILPINQRYDGHSTLMSEDSMQQIKRARAEAVYIAWLERFECKFSSTFPREIRDMIYQHVLEKPDEFELCDDAYTVPCSVPTCSIDYFKNPTLPHFLRLPTDTGMARELAALFCEQKRFRIFGLERLDVFLNTPFLVPGFIPRDHIRDLQVILRPPYWDLPELPGNMMDIFKEKVPKSLHVLELLLQAKHSRGFRLNIVVVVARLFRPHITDTTFRRSDPNVKFIWWMEAALPLLARLHNHGLVLDIEQVHTDGRTIPRIFPIRVNAETLFNYPEQHWPARLGDLSAFVRYENSGSTIANQTQQYSSIVGYKLSSKFARAFGEVYRTRKMPVPMRPCVVSAAGCYSTISQMEEKCFWCSLWIGRTPNYEYPNNLGWLEKEEENSMNSDKSRSHEVMKNCP